MGSLQHSEQEYIVPFPMKGEDIKPPPPPFFFFMFVGYIFVIDCYKKNL